MLRLRAWGSVQGVSVMASIYTSKFLDHSPLEGLTYLIPSIL